MYQRNYRFFKVVACLFLILMASTSFAQDKVSTEDTTNNVYSSQSVPGLIARADQMYEYGDRPDALRLYQMAYEKDTTNIRANFMIGVCHLELLNKAGGLKYLLYVYGKDPDYDQNILFYIAESYHFNHRFEEAIEFYKMYRASIRKQHKHRDLKDHEYESMVKTVKRKIEECHNGIELLKDPLEVQIIDLGENINSEYPDYTPAVTAKEDYMVYTSRRAGSTGDLLHTDKLHFEDIYYSRKDRFGNWIPSKNIGLSINTISHDAVISISPDGKELFIYKDKGGGDIYESKRNFRGEWSKPIPLKAVNTSAMESHITEDNSGELFIFASDRKGGFGGLDLYMITRDKTGKWGEPINLGNHINTEYDESSPFLDKNGDLYFSSRGHKGIGMHDIYKSFRNEKNGKWGAPENIGYPINTADDDLYFILPGSGDVGYYSSYNVKSYGGKDIYMVKLLKGEEMKKSASASTGSRKVYLQLHDMTMERPKAVEQVKHEVTLVHGFIKDYNTNEGIYAAVALKDSATGDVIEETMTDSLTGEYSLLVPSGKTYLYSAEKPEYMYFYEYVALPNNDDHEHEEYKKNIKMQHLVEGTSVKLHHIYFDVDRATLKEESFPELQRFAQLMMESPTMTIEVSGHTDNLGQEEYNKMLSQWRAQAVVDYFIKLGLDESRFTSVGYGSDFPVATNETMTGRHDNRRIEIKITSK